MTAAEIRERLAAAPFASLSIVGATLDENELPPDPNHRACGPLGCNLHRPCRCAKCLASPVHPSQRAA